jgi:CRP-like cAMP-binding protein
MASQSKVDTIARRMTFLQSVPLFVDLSEADLETLVTDFRLREYGKDEIIFHQEDNSNELYVVMEGKVRIFVISPSGSETSLEIFGQRGVIGEYATIDNIPRSATAKAIVPTTLLQMMADRFLHHMRQMPDLAIAMTKLLVAKSRRTAVFAETIAQYDAAGRLLHRLLVYNETMGEEIEPDKEYVIDLGLNQTDLASLVGARREWVNRILRDWRKRGLIKYSAGKIFIMDLPRGRAERDSRIEANHQNNGGVW